MIDIVLDANVAIDWFVNTEQGTAYSARLAKLIGEEEITFHVPLSFEPEVCGQLVRHHRHKPELHSKAWLSGALRMLDYMPIKQHALGVNFTVTGELAESYRLSVYDVQYFHLARILEHPIASRDRGIISACKAWHVTHWQP